MLYLSVDCQPPRHMNHQQVDLTDIIHTNPGLNNALSFHGLPPDSSRYRYLGAASVYHGSCLLQGISGESAQNRAVYIATRAPSLQQHAVNKSADDINMGLVGRPFTADGTTIYAKDWSVD